MSRRLLVLDLNGVLHKRTRGGITLRPYAKEFVTECLNRYDVAFFTSTTEPIASKALERLLTPEERGRVVFIWFRDRTEKDPERRLNSSHPSWTELNRGERLFNHSTIKRISLAIDSFEVNPYGEYTWTNVVLCDDSPTKMRFNPRANCIVVTPFVEEDDVLLFLMDEIEERFASLIC